MNKEDEQQNIILNETEEKLLMDHNYDGIEEFDYPLPSWWLWTFIGGGFFAVFYIYYYNFAGAPSIREEYNKELARVELVREEQRKLTGYFDTEAFNTWSEKPESLQQAALVYEENCLSCHEEKGMGDIGPNLTDEYWLNLKSLSAGSIYGFILVGNEDNGMPAWADTLSKEELFAAVKYVLSVQSTNAPGGKEPQGVKLK